MNVFLFPGQGSQQIGMGADLFQTDASFRQLVELASECVGTDLQRICLRGPERELVRTEYLQPLLVAVSLGYYGRLIQIGVRPDLVLGHSLGEITALAAAGVLSPETALRVAARRGAIMGAAAAQNPGGMLAVLSPRREQVLEAVSGLRRGERVFLANDNAPNQLLLSGEADALAETSRSLSAARLGPCKKLPVSGPWHSPLMLAAQKEFGAWLEPIRFERPLVPIVMNVSALAESNPNTIRDLVVRNLTEPVQWRISLETVKALSPKMLFEIGPGRVLSGLARANGFGPEVQVCSIKSLSSLPDSRV